MEQSNLAILIEKVSRGELEVSLDTPAASAPPSPYQTSGRSELRRQWIPCRRILAEGAALLRLHAVMNLVAWMFQSKARFLVARTGRGPRILLTHPRGIAHLSL